MDQMALAQPETRFARFNTGLALALLVVTGLILVALPFLAIDWARKPFIGFFVEPNLVINDTKGTNWPAKTGDPPFPLALPDRVIVLDGKPIHTVGAYQAQMGTYAVGDIVSVTLLRNWGADQEAVELELISFPRRDLFLMFWLPYAAGLALLSFGGWVFWLRRHLPAGRAFAIFSALSTLSLALVFDLWTTQVLSRLWTLALPAAAAALMSLALIFPQETRLTQRWPALRWLPAVPGLAIGVLSQFVLYSDQSPWAYILAWRHSYRFAALALLFFLGMVIYRRYWSVSPVAREQSRVILWGSFVAFAPLSAWMILASLDIPPGFDVSYALPIVLFPASVAYAIIRYRLLNVDRLVRQAMVYLLLSALVVLATVLLVNLAGIAIGTVVSLGEPVIIALVATALVIAFNPLRQRLQSIVDRVFHLQRRDYQRHVQQFSHALTIAFDLDNVVSALGAAVSTALEPESLVIYLLDRRSSAFLAVHAEHVTAPPLLADAPLIAHLSRQRGVVFVGSPIYQPTELDSSDQARATDGLRAMNAHLVAPIQTADELCGFLVIGAARSGQPYPGEAVGFLETVADQASLAVERAQVLRDTTVRAQQLSLLNQASRSLTATLDLDPLLEIIMDKAVEVLQADAGSFMLLDQEKDELIFAVCHGSVAANLEGSRIPATAGLAGATVSSRRPIIANDARTDDRWFQAVDERTDFVTNSILAVPLISKSEVIGVLELINKRNRLPFNEEDQELAAAFAAQAALAIENAQLYTQTDQMLAQRVLELTMMQELDRILNATLDIGRVMSMTLDWVMRVSHANSGAIGLVDLESSSVQILAAQGNGDWARPPDGHQSWPLDAGIVGRVVRSGTACLVADVSQDSDRLVHHPATQSQLAVPISREEQVIGIILLESKVTDGFGPDQLQTAARFADHAAVAIDNARLYDAVKRANLAKSEFVSLVSHELKTPMTSIRGYADLMLSRAGGELSPTHQGFVQTIMSNVERMRGLVNDLADISRIETGHLTIEIRPVAFGLVVEEALNSLRGLIEEKGLELLLETPAELPQVEGDHRRLVQVLTNLLSNATKYTPPPGRITLSVRLDSCPPEGKVASRCLVCAVQDTGIGISAKEQEQLFSKFFRSDAHYVRETTGTGLGLFITRSLVEMHGGAIWVESEPGEGSTFTFAIPCLASQDDRVAAPRMLERRAPGARVPFRGTD